MLPLQIKLSVALALLSIFLAGLPSVLGVLPLWLTVSSPPKLMQVFAIIQVECTLTPICVCLDAGTVA